MSMNCYNTLRVIPILIEEDAKEQASAFWRNFAEIPESGSAFTFDKLVPEPSGEFDRQWRFANWGVEWILGGEYEPGSEVQQFITKNAAPVEFFIRVSAKFPALIFFLETTIWEDNFSGHGFYAGGKFVIGRGAEIYSPEYIKRDILHGKFRAYFSRFPSPQEGIRKLVLRACEGNCERPVEEMVSEIRDLIDDIADFYGLKSAEDSKAADGESDSGDSAATFYWRG